MIATADMAENAGLIGEFIGIDFLPVFQGMHRYLKKVGSAFAARFGSGKILIARPHILSKVTNFCQEKIASLALHGIRNRLV